MKISHDPSVPVAPPGEPAGVGRVGFREVFGVGEFRALWAAQLLSVAGDQLARVALTLLVYDRTHSALLAAVTFAASVVPVFLGGVLLSGLADRLPRRELMIVCDVGRAVLVAVMAGPGVPVPVLVGLLFVVTLVGAPFSAARAALYPEILTGDRYVVGSAVTMTTLQFAQVAGFAGGGIVAGFFGTRVSLAADSVTFLCSAAFTLAWVSSRPASAAARQARRLSLAGARLVFGDARLRTPMLLGWLAAATCVYEGVAAPLAGRRGGGDGADPGGGRGGLSGGGGVLQPVRRPGCAAAGDGAAGRRGVRHLGVHGAAAGPGGDAGGDRGERGVLLLPARGQRRVRGRHAARAAG
jgi:MFS family permease